jgi:gluconate 2-dehydrogenase gamma chain
MSKFNRRDFIKKAGVVVVGVSLLPSCSTKNNDQSYYRFFTNEEGECVIAMCEQIIPAHDNYGGATDAGVIFYIDRQLPGYFNDHALTYRESIQKVQAYCKNEYGKVFQDLSFEQQLDIMDKMSTNKIDPEEWKNSSNFFRLIQQHTMQGFYGSPIHGGNKDYMSFDMLRLDYPLNIGQNRYKKPLHQI